ncbi:hypothetical protein BC834DRAFT_971271 [Gloeopeniophorella convolvens]|nr:hypothetical protein BC834DRAFT_971271 [Gloeopeniophorella convolvens]
MAIMRPDVPALVSRLSLLNTQHAVDQCTKTIGWLEDGAEFESMPDVLAVWLDQSNMIYNSSSIAPAQYTTHVSISVNLTKTY